MKRRDFLKLTAAAATAFAAGPLPSLLAEGTPSIPDLVRVENGEPAQLLAAALKEFGGMKQFVAAGDMVVIKPNIGWDRAPELAGCTNPDLVAEVVKACLEAGAKKVRIFDRTCNNPQRCYANSQIEEKATAAGAEVYHIEDSKFKTIPLKNGEILKEWPIYQDYLETNKVINIPIAKHHRLANVTLGLKNLMGVMGGNRGDLHASFVQKILDISSAILPSLTIIDAYRILTKNGPSGGNPADVKVTKTLIMSPCTVSADMNALDLFDLKLENVEYIKAAYARKLHKFEPDKLQVKKITLS